MTDTGNYEEILELWRSKLREAQLHHSAAVKKYRQVARDNKAGVYAFPCGVRALQQAQREETCALEEYMRVLIIFNDILIRG